MRRIFILAVFVSFIGSAFAQSDTTLTGNPRARKAIPNDHFMIQFGGTGWANKPDSIKTAGFSRTFNMYVMLDFPFKTNPNFSVAIGPGIATDNVFLDKTSVGIKDNTATVRFQNLKDTVHFKTYKLATAYAEAPVELRYSSNPDDNSKSIKAAIGAKVGMLLSAWVKGSKLESSSGTLLNGYTLKEKSKNYFNTLRISLSGRVGYGNFSLFGSYALTPLFKEGLGPKMNAYSIGLAISGL
jgi:hypothetical protein